jgi:hypothetical protein
MSSQSAPSKHPNGISLAGFRALIDAHVGRAELEGKTTMWVKWNVVLPATAPAKTPYTALMDGAHVAPATAFVSHAYDDEFLGMVDAIATLEAREGTTSAFYYVDLLVVNQHENWFVPFEALRDEFGESVRAIGRTLVYLRWENPIPMQRAWCVFEMGTTLEVGAGLKVIMPPADVASFKHALEDDFDSLTYKTCRVDVEKATAREVSDLLNTQRAIVEGGGFLKTNQLVIGAMKGWMVEEATLALEAMHPEVRGLSPLIINLARLLRDMGKFSGAEPLNLEALDARRRALGDSHPDTLTAINSMGLLLQAEGRFGKAEPLFREALSRGLSTLGGEHINTLQSMNNLATLLQAQGKSGEAEPMHRKALSARRRTLGDEHPDTLQSISNLATLLQAQGESGEAELLCREALSARRRTLGDKHPDTLHSMSNLATLLQAQGKSGEAMPLSLEALSTRRRTLGDEHPDTLTSICVTAEFMQLRGAADFDNANQLLLEACAVLGASHPITLRASRALAALRLAQRRHEDAVPLLHATLERSYDTLGSAHPDTQLALLLLSRAHRGADRSATAEHLLNEAAKAARLSAHELALQRIEERLDQLRGAEVTNYSRSAAYRAPRAAATDPLAIPTHGVSFAGVLRFLKDAGGCFQVAGRTTTEVNARFVVPATLKRRSTYAEELLDSGCAVAAAAVGPATVFISHSWSMKFDQLLTALLVLQERAEREGARPPFFWLDILVNRQSDTAGKPFDWWQRIFRDNVRGIRHTALVLDIEDEKSALKRSWCLWEMACSLLDEQGAAAGGGGGGGAAAAAADHDVRFEVVLPPGAEAGFRLVQKENAPQLQKHVDAVDVALASAFHGAECLVDVEGGRRVCKEVLSAKIRECPCDLQNIKGAVGARAGKINAAIQQRLRAWLAEGRP